MKSLAQINDVKVGATTKASDVARQLAFAGFAVLWLVREPPPVQIPVEICRIALVFGISLALDMLQYGLASLIWVVFYNTQYEKLGGNERAEVDIPDALNYPTYACFWIKISGVLFAWAMLGDFLISKWKLSLGSS